jgi:ATP dependent DNA ligase domain
MRVEIELKAGRSTTEGPLPASSIPSATSVPAQLWRIVLDVIMIEFCAGPPAVASRAGCIYAFPMRLRYVLPSAPTLRSAPPRGEQWIHEVKFDGWRIQRHKHGSSAAAFTKNGHDCSNRVRWMVDALACLPGARSLVIDGETRGM